MLSITLDRKRIKYVIAAVTLVLLFVILVQGMLQSEGAYVPANKIKTTNDERSQVYVGGSNYELDVKTKEEHKEQQEKRREIIRERERTHQQTAAQKRLSETREQPKQPEQTQPTRGNDQKKQSGQANIKRPGRSKNNSKAETSGKSDENRRADSNNDDNRRNAGTVVTGRPVQKPAPKPKKKKAKEPSEPEKPKKDKNKDDTVAKKENRLPTIKTSLKDGQKKNGESVSFWVQATDYKNQNIPVFSNDEGHFEVYINGEQIASSGSNGNKTNFRAEVVDGINEIQIYATDKRDKEARKTIKIRCDISEPDKVIGTVYVSMYADSLGIGTIFTSQKVDITEQMPLSEILKAAFSAQGISSEMSKNYLAGVSRTGIAKNADITDELRDKAAELRVTVYEKEDWPSGWQDHLREKDFCNTSGWTYYVNGNMPNVGIGSFIPDDGDEIELVFQLFNGDMD